jgi:hypothetical protein
MCWHICATPVLVHTSDILRVYVMPHFINENLHNHIILFQKEENLKTEQVVFLLPCFPKCLKTLTVPLTLTSFYPTNLPKSRLGTKADKADACFRHVPQILHDRFSQNLVHNRMNSIIKSPTRFRRERCFPFYRHGVFLTY